MGQSLNDFLTTLNRVFPVERNVFTSRIDLLHALSKSKVNMTLQSRCECRCSLSKG